MITYRKYGEIVEELAEARGYDWKPLEPKMQAYNYMLIAGKGGVVKKEIQAIADELGMSFEKLMEWVFDYHLKHTTPLQKKDPQRYMKKMAVAYGAAKRMGVKNVLIKSARKVSKKR